MKSAKKLNGLLVLAILFLTNYGSFAQTYTSMVDGNWNDMATVWSLDGGVTPCGCTPGALTGGADIVINNNITTDYNIVVNAGSNFTMNPGSSLTGVHNLNTFNATFLIQGNITLNRWTQGVNVNTSLIGSIMTINNRFRIEGGTFNLIGSVINMPLGNFEIVAGASFIATGGSRVSISAGNINNYGNLHIDSDCCLTTTGNWRNHMTGVVTGSGSATSTSGNMRNDGVWDPLIRWCSAGSDVGMPSAEDCTNATGICDAIVLPIELVDFSAEVNNGQVDIYWATASELNNDYFILLESADGKDWTEIDRVDGAGTTQELTEYFTVDYDINPGVTYYKLVQVDFDSRQSESDVIAVNYKLATEELLVYPNPARGTEDITIANLADSKALINIYSTSGVLMAQVEKNDFSEFVKISSSELENGLYIIAVEQDGNLRQTKLMVSK
jgi:hypothetical protein